MPNKVNKPKSMNEGEHRKVCDECEHMTLHLHNVCLLCHPEKLKLEPKQERWDKWKMARFMHEKYERYAFIFGWSTQEKTRVPFEELPEENKKTMLAVADDIVSLIEKIESRSRTDAFKEVAEYVANYQVDLCENSQKFKEDILSRISEDK